MESEKIYMLFLLIRHICQTFYFSTDCRIISLLAGVLWPLRHIHTSQKGRSPFPCISCVSVMMWVCVGVVSRFLRLPVCLRSCSWSQSPPQECSLYIQVHSPSFCQIIQSPQGCKTSSLSSSVALSCPLCLHACSLPQPALPLSAFVPYLDSGSPCQPCSALLS